MSFFMTNKQAAEKISGLEARVAELEADLSNANSTIETLQTEANESSATYAENIASITTERDEAVSKLSTAEQTIADQEQTIAEANEKIASFDEEVNNKVLHGIANLGFKGEIPESSQEIGSVESVTRAEFNAMKPAARLAFVKGGGKIK